MKRVIKVQNEMKPKDGWKARLPRYFIIITIITKLWNVMSSIVRFSPGIEYLIIFHPPCCNFQVSGQCFSLCLRWTTQIVRTLCTVQVFVYWRRCLKIFVITRGSRPSQQILSDSFFFRIRNYVNTNFLSVMNRIKDGSIYDIMLEFGVLLFDLVRIFEAYRVNR